MVKKKQHDIRLKQGEDFSLAFVVRDTDGNAVDLTGASVTAQLREYPEYGDQYDFTCRHNNAGGRVTMTMPKELTSIIAYSYGTYDVFVTYANGTVEQVLWGRVFIVSEVTRVQAGTQQIVLAFTCFDDFPEVGNLYRLYLDCDAGLLYRWTGTQYVNALEGLRGDKGDDGRGILEIRKVATSENGLVDTYELEYTDGETWLFYVHNGNGILTIQKVGTAGLVDTYRISMQDGTYTDFEVTNGSGIRTISKTRSVGLTDIYTIYFENGNKTTFSVTNGRDGAGSIVWVEDRVAHVRTLNTLNIDDIPGLYERLKGDKGDRGNGIVSIELTGTSGRNKTYTITYDDETTSTFVVMDGATGQQGTAATIEVTGVNTLSAGTPAYVQEASGSTAQNRKLIFGIPQGPQGVPGQAGTSVPWSGITGSPTDNAALVTKLAEYVLKAGDTMTGGLVIASGAPLTIKRDGDKIIAFSAADGTKQGDMWVANSNHRFGFRSWDDDASNKEVFYLPAPGSLTEDATYNILTDKNIDNTPTAGSANPVKSSGIKSALDGKADTSHTHDDCYYTESEMDTLLAGKASVSHNHEEYVQKSGDTMTGGLNIASGTPLSILRNGDKIIAFKAADGTEQGAMWVANNTHAICFRSYDADYSHYERYNLPTPDALTANVSYYILTTKNPVTVAQGGTGGTDSGWKSLTNSTVFTGSIVYRKIGVFCFVTGAVKLVNNLTSDYIDLGTMPTGYRPNTNTIYGFGGGQDYLGVITIRSDGGIRFFKTTQVSTWSNTANIYFQFSYFCA